MKRLPIRRMGFTLTEAMVVVALLAVLAAIAAPAFRNLVGTMNTKSVAFDLISDLTAARSEAIKRNASTTIAPVGDDWANGWQITSGAATLRERVATGYAVSISAPTAGVVFAPNGRIGEDTVEDSLTWTVSSTIAGVIARCVVITPTGAARSKTGAC